MPTPSYRSGSHPEKRGELPPDQEQVAEALDDIDKRLTDLRAAFDRFFLGIEKRNPSKDADSLRHKLLRLKQQFIRNTALKFRLDTLMSKFQAYERLWFKTLKEMEEGTYRRDLAKLRRKREREVEAERAPKPPPLPGGGPRPPAAAQNGEGSGAEHAGLLNFFEGELDKGLLEWEPPSSQGRRPTLSADEKTPVVPLDAEAIRAAAAARTPSPASPARRRPTSLDADADAAKPTAPTGEAKSAPRPAAPASSPAAKPPPTSASPARGPAAGGVRPNSPAVDSNASAGAAAQRGGGGSGSVPLSKPKLQQIYDAYLVAKRRCRESTDGVTLDSVAETVRQQLQVLRNPGVRQVDFKIVIKDGRALLKVVPK